MVLVKWTAAAEPSATGGEHYVAADDVGDRHLTLHARRAFVPEAAPGRRFIHRHRRVRLRWRRYGLRKEHDKVLARLPKPHEEAGHLTALADLLRQLDN